MFTKSCGMPRTPEALGHLNLASGWTIFDKPVNSYEFARIGYTMILHSAVMFLYGDLAERLLAKDPMDRTVVISMTGEFLNYSAGLDQKFVQRLENHLERIRKSSKWQPFDLQNFVQIERALGSVETLHRRNNEKAKIHYAKASELNTQLIKTVERFPEHKWRNEYYKQWDSELRKALAEVSK
jgi:hypothetical protein